MKTLYLRCTKIFFSFFVLALGFSFSGIKAEAALLPTVEQMQQISKIFDANYYAMTYPDVAIYYNNDELAMFNHYVTRGIYESRNPSPYFNATAYMKRYPDLQAAYGMDMLSYASHYARRGMDEGRDGSPEEGLNPELVAAFANNQSSKLISVFFTEYDPNAARGHNIELAASHVNGTVVKPGKSFSASNAIGQRTTANGFVEAPVFINKKHDVGIGGGVCQVSSTIYAAIKSAGIKATERHAHSLPVTYLPEGWDATISWGALDMRFTNPYKQDMVVSAFTDKGRLIIALYLQE